MGAGTDLYNLMLEDKKKKKTRGEFQKEVKTKEPAGRTALVRSRFI